MPIVRSSNLVSEASIRTLPYSRFQGGMQWRLTNRTYLQVEGEFSIFYTSVSSRIHLYGVHVDHGWAW